MTFFSISSNFENHTSGRINQMSESTEDTQVPIRIMDSWGIMDRRKCLNHSHPPAADRCCTMWAQKKKTFKGKTKMNNNIISKAVVAAAFLVTGIGCTNADEDVDKLIAHARAAAPAAVSADATIVINGEVAVEGSNGWTCMPEVFPGDGASVCVDAVWGEMMGALGAKEAFAASKVGISYMLLGDAGGGVSNSDPYHEDPKNADDYVETGPHLMVIVPKEALQGMSDDPSTGGPYVMWKDTDYAHIMIPVE